MSTNLNIFPAPRTVTFGETTVNLAEIDWVILPQSCSTGLRNRVFESAERLSRMLNKPVRVAAVPPRNQKILLEIRTDVPRLSEQSYKLKIGAAERLVAAGGEAGAFYGCLAFVQLIEQFGTTPPILTIDDAPDFPVRGVMLDVSRCKVPTMGTCKQLIDQLAGLRINQLQLYTEHTFAFSAHKAVWYDSSPLTHEEILELDQYCADRFIDLVPNLNSFGHFGRWLKHPEYRHLAECPENPETNCLAPEAESLRLLASLYDEYLPHFSSSLFNVGCDETMELGKGRSKARAEKTSTTTVYFDFLKKIHRLCAERGRRMQFWGDIILHEPELIKELPEDILALCWGYEADHPYDKECPVFADAGIDYYVCPGTSAWSSITGRTANCLANLENAARNGLKHGAVGYLIPDWGDGGHHQVLPISYPGFAAGAAYSWCFKANRDADLAGALSRCFFQDPTGRLGQFCLDLGRTPDRIPGLVRGNCSAIHQLLFNKMKNGSLDLSNVTSQQYAEAEGWLDKLTDDLTEARPACNDHRLVLQELWHTLAVGRHAIHRGCFVQFGDGSADMLRHELQNVIMSHEEQWLARNRRGGLNESSTRLRQTAVTYDGKPV